MARITVAGTRRGLSLAGAVVLVALAAAAARAASAPARPPAVARFSVRDAVVLTAAASADGRLRVRAALAHAAPQRTRAGAPTVTGTLPALTANGACISDLIFRNGFQY